MQYDGRGSRREGRRQEGIQDSQSTLLLTPSRGSLRVARWSLAAVGVSLILLLLARKMTERERKKEGGGDQGFSINTATNLP